MTNQQLYRLGLIINPIAGMGGSVGLKGTDGEWAVDRAIELGAIQKSEAFAKRAFSIFHDIKDQLEILTCSGNMGGNLMDELGFHHQIIYTPNNSQKTDQNDTITATSLLKQIGIDLLVFVGGDGTARDICNVINQDVVAIGIPAGVKMYSPVYATTPENGGRLIKSFLTSGRTHTVQREVLDIDEISYREDHLSVSLYGYLKTPAILSFMQNKKSPTPQSEEGSQRSIALEVTDHMDRWTYYILSPGSTTQVILNHFGLEGTLLGVDVIKDGQIILKDANENDLLRLTESHQAKLIITPTGGQGYLLGRGNQQLSPEVLKRIGKDNIIIIATDWKLIELHGKPLLIYTGDEAVDELLSGYYKIITSYGRYKMYKVGNST